MSMVDLIPRLLDFMKDIADLHKCIIYIHGCTSNAEKPNPCVIAEEGLGGDSIMRKPSSRKGSHRGFILMDTPSFEYHYNWTEM